MANLPFSSTFARWARRIRGRIALRRLLTGAAIGLGAGALAAALLWWARLGPLRPWAFALGVVGAIAGLIYSLRKRWSDTDVALYLDAKLETKEAISTAVEIQGQDGEVHRTIVSRAAEKLAAGDPKRAKPKLLKPLHGIGPLSGAALAWLCFIPLPPLPPAPPPPPGAEQIKVENLKGLDKIEALANLKGRNPEQDEQLKAIAKEAKKLREDLKKGMEKREAQARVAKLRDDIAKQRLRFGDKKNRAGLDAAVDELRKNANTKKAAEALSDGDLVEFDREMRKLANLKEKEAREAAKKALEEALKAAKKKGAKDLAQSLEEQKRAFGEREGKAEALRELAEALRDQGKLSEDAKRDLEEFGQSGDPTAGRRLAESMEKALQGLSPEERKRLAENLKKRMAQQQQSGTPNPMTKDQMEELERRLRTPEGQKQLQQQLRELAKEKPGGDAQREQGLGDADKGGAQAQRGLGMPVPTPGQGGSAGKKGNSGGKKPNQSTPSQGNASGGPGSKKDTGKGDHSGSTKKIPGKELKSKAQARLNPGGKMHSSTLGHAPGKGGETANRAGSGALGKAAPGEVSGVERSEVPEEYRKQVGRYFEP